jgi:hypothetical protein
MYLSQSTQNKMSVRYFFSSHNKRPCELLPSLGVRLSVVCQLYIVSFTFMVSFRVFQQYFSYIWQTVLLVEETRVIGEGLNVRGLRRFFNIHCMYGKEV